MQRKALLYVTIIASKMMHDTRMHYLKRNDDLEHKASKGNQTLDGRHRTKAEKI